MRLSPTIAANPICCFLLFAAASTKILASAQLAEVCESLHPYSYDSGMVSAVVADIRHPSAPWIQLDLSGTKLKPGAKLVLVGDYASQELDADALMSNDFSAVFDGDGVSVELVTGRGEGPFGGDGRESKSRVVVSAVKVGLCGYENGGENGGAGGGEGEIAEDLCGVDDRTASSDVRVGRIGPCTGWLISEDVFVQAGHCPTPSTSTRIHFTSDSSSAGTQDQYAVDVSTYRPKNRQYAGVGRDWGVGRLLPNSSTLKRAGEAQTEICSTPGCGWYDIGTVPVAPLLNNIRVTGYGLPNVQFRSQKSHMGDLTQVTSTYLRYTVDTTAGNSGSPVIDEETGKAIGIHTHSGCNTGGNRGTRIDNSDLAAHIDFLTRTCTNDSDCFHADSSDETYCDAANKQCQFGVNPQSPTAVPQPTLSPTPKPTTQRPTRFPTTSPTSPTPCIEDVIEVVVKTDNYPAETSWTLFNECEGIQVHESPAYATKGRSYLETYCLPPASYKFEIKDSYGDGICCQYGQGFYKVTLNGDQVVASSGDFQSSNSTNFGSCTTAAPSKQPSTSPSQQPSTSPSKQPSTSPSKQPSTSPSKQLPTSKQPSASPSSKQPTAARSEQPTFAPTTTPSKQPSAAPTAAPSKQPTAAPSKQPTAAPSKQPTAAPSQQPSSSPSKNPTLAPSEQPSTSPSKQPSASPSKQLTAAPSEQPTAQPTAAPSRVEVEVVCSKAWARGRCNSKTTCKWRKLSGGCVFNCRILSSQNECETENDCAWRRKKEKCRW